MVTLLLVLLVAPAVLSQEYRLPSTVTPLHYTIKIVPFLVKDNFTFNGEVDITVTAVSSTDNITLHHNNLEILETPVVTSLDGLHGLEVVDTSYDNDTHFYTLHLNDTLESDARYLINIKYIGDMENGMSGFYKISYNTSKNETRWLATTQFEPVSAREAFPCFDEPALKAKFQVNIARLPEYHSVSNMPLLNSSEPDAELEGRIWDSFQETPLMSTYLVAFVVSDLKNLTSKDGKYSLWMREEVLSQGKYALSISPSIIQILEQYTDIKYELPKMDEVAVPDHFFWAMENWGLVTIWEKELINSRGTSLAETKEDTLLVVAHEFAHQWFGNVVSPKWWDYLWLNEGFATFFEYKISSILEPDWGLDKLFLASMFQPALIEDSLNTTHPITHAVNTPDEIDKNFDTIAYNKAGCVIRSMEHFLTAETLRKALSKYLKRHSHSVAEPDDLFRILDEQQKADGILGNDMDVKTIMDSWTLQPGYPLLQVNRVDGAIHVSQERFLILGPGNSVENPLWWVPISYTTRKESDFTNTKPRAWLKANPEMKLVDELGDDEWIILNVQSTGFYRVNYDPLTWSLIIKQMIENHKVIHVMNRAQLLDDLFSLAQAGMFNYSRALDLTVYLHQESDPLPWMTILNKMFYVARQLHGSQVHVNFKKYILSLISNMYDTVAFRKELNHELKTVERKVIKWACLMDHKDCVTKTVELFSDWMANPDDDTIIPADLKDVVYCTAVRHNRKMWEFLWKQYQAATEKDEQNNMYQALGCIEDDEMLRRFMNLSLLSKNDFYDSLEASVFYVLRSSPRGVEASLDFITDNFPFILNNTEDTDNIGSIIAMIADHVTTREQAERIKELLEEHELDHEAEENNWIPETMEEDIKWTEKHIGTISIWLDNYLNEKQENNFR